MKIHKHPLLLAMAAVTAVTVPHAAHANDDDENFEGVSVGVQGGYSRQRIDETVLTGADAVTIDARQSGVTYGGYIGYDAQFENFVIGVEAGFNPSERKLTDTVTSGGSVELNPQWSADASVRAGIVLNDRILAYGRVGYSRSRYKLSRFDGVNTAATVSERENGDGVMFGGGAEFAVTHYAALRVEYRRNNFGDTFRSDQVLAGATLRF
ncbi:outer membrane beta-barrel protein [Erythrobacter sp. F6033]|uniref:outer membrane protein n=1 Tax=Erythrobacter sp. F6033 TaxID=2926401 RepID=UPI001FF538B1|nr:outer membrane beta-barrel protein [Erythrobacter sp. F6033]MCK0128920.1 outer membrane beta-barrel protein [Erythrobacter sp. F6033]